MVPEFALVAWLGERLDVPVSGDVPNPRPEKLVSIERTGGPPGRFMDVAQVDIHCWAETRAEARKLAERVKSELWAFADEPGVNHLEFQTLANFPAAPDQPRYLLGVTLNVVPG